MVENTSSFSFLFLGQTDMKETALHVFIVICATSAAVRLKSQIRRVSLGRALWHLIVIPRANPEVLYHLTIIAVLQRYSENSAVSRLSLLWKQSTVSPSHQPTESIHGLWNMQDVLHLCADQFESSTSPPGQPPGHLNFWRLACSNSLPSGQKSRSNAPPVSTELPLLKDKFHL